MSNDTAPAGKVCLTPSLIANAPETEGTLPRGSADDGQDHLGLCGVTDQLAQDLDASPAAIERVRSEVQIEAVLLFGLRTAPERVRLLKQANGPGTPGDQNRCCKPGHTASNDNYIALIFI